MKKKIRLFSETSNEETEKKVNRWLETLSTGASVELSVSGSGEKVTVMAVYDKA